LCSEGFKSLTAIAQQYTKDLKNADISGKLNIILCLYHVISQGTYRHGAFTGIMLLFGSG